MALIFSDFKCCFGPIKFMNIDEVGQCIFPFSILSLELPNLGSNTNQREMKGQGLMYDLCIYLFWWGCGLNSGLHACKAGSLLLEPHLQGRGLEK
jgi:hypothetical protein